ncbi:hypothetical protein NDU88_000495, partial [Pleurodeles waltl]
CHRPVSTITSNCNSCHGPACKPGSHYFLDCEVPQASPSPDTKTSQTPATEAQQHTHAHTRGRRQGHQHTKLQKVNWFPPDLPSTLPCRCRCGDSQGYRSCS